MRRAGQEGRMGGEASGPRRHLALVVALAVILSWQVSLHADVSVHVRLNYGGTQWIDVTNQTQDWIVGLKAPLDTVVWRDGVQIIPSARSWSVAGKTFTMWETSTTKATLKTLTDTDLQGAIVSFFWANAGSGLQVSCTVTVEGHLYSAQTTFNVKRPTSTLTTSTGSVVIGTSWGMPALSFGVKTGPVGIVFTRTVTEPTGFQNGTTEWVQVVDSTTRFLQGPAGDQWQATGQNLLDNSLPYGTGATVADSPRLVLTTSTINYVRGSSADSFTMYLMYKPAGLRTSWVPLRKVSWSWAGDGVRDSATWDAGDLVSSSHSINPASVNWTDHPVWDGNVTGIQWVRIS